MGPPGFTLISPTPPCCPPQPPALPRHRQHVNPARHHSWRAPPGEPPQGTAAGLGAAMAEGSEHAAHGAACTKQGPTQGFKRAAPDQTPLRLKACVMLRKSCARQQGGHRALVALAIHLSPTGGLCPGQCGCGLILTAVLTRAAPRGQLWGWQQSPVALVCGAGRRAMQHPGMLRAGTAVALLPQSIPVPRERGQPQRLAEDRSVPALRTRLSPWEKTRQLGQEFALQDFWLQSIHVPSLAFLSPGTCTVPISAGLPSSRSDVHQEHSLLQPPGLISSAEP